MSLLSLCVLFSSCSAASRSHDFTLCNTLAQWSDVVSTPSKYMSTQESLTYLHSLPCLNLCFNQKLLPIPRSRPTFKLALILLLAGDVSLNRGPVIRHHIRLATTNMAFRMATKFLHTSLYLNDVPTVSCLLHLSCVLLMMDLPFISSSTVWRQVVFGYPLLLFLSGVQCTAILVIDVSSFRSMWPIILPNDASQVCEGGSACQFRLPDLHS